MNHIAKRIEVRKEGAYAYDTGLDISENPYTDDELANCWDIGWLNRGNEFLTFLAEYNPIEGENK